MTTCRKFMRSGVGWLAVYIPLSILAITLLWEFLPRPAYWGGVIELLLLPISVALWVLMFYLGWFGRD